MQAPLHPSQNWSSTVMNLPTYGQPQRTTIGGLIKTGRLAPLPEPQVGRHAEERDNPQAVTVAQLALRCDPYVVRWFAEQQTADTRRIERVALPAVGGAL